MVDATSYYLPLDKPLNDKKKWNDTTLRAELEVVPYWLPSIVAG